MMNWDGIDILQIMPARPGLLAVYDLGNGQESTLAVEAWALVENRNRSSHNRYVVAMILEEEMGALDFADATHFSRIEQAPVPACCKCSTPAP